MKKKKLFQKILSGSENIRFEEVRGLMQGGEAIGVIAVPESGRVGEGNAKSSWCRGHFVEIRSQRARNDVRRPNVLTFNERPTSEVSDVSSSPVQIFSHRRSSVSKGMT